MPRVKLIPCENYSFSVDIVVRVTDINYGGHAGNDSIMGFIHHARIDVLNSLGFTEKDLGDGHTGLIQTDCAIVYLSESYVLDVVTAECQFTELKGSTFRMCYRLRKDNETIVLAEAGFAGFDYTSRKLSSLPDGFREVVTLRQQL